MAFTPTEEAQLRAVIEAFESGKTISEIAASTEVFTTDALEVIQEAVSKKATIAQIVTLVNSELGISTISSKLSGIAAGAQVNVIESVKVNNTVLPISSKSVNITVPTQPSDIGAEPALGFTPEQAGVAESLITALKNGVSTEGNTLKKLYDLILASFSEVQVTTIAARDAYNITKLPTNVFVLDDGDSKWALYKATTTGVNATYVKLSDPDLLNAVMTASQIAISYESVDDVNRFTDALKAKLDAFTANFTVELKAAYDGKQNSLTIGNLTSTTSGVTIGNGTGAVIGSGATVNIATAGASSDGILTSGHFNTFNNKVSNATHTGDVTGSTALTLATVNSNIGTFNNVTINAKGLATAGSNVSYEPSFTKNTAFNKNFGTTTGTVLEGRTFGTAAGSAVGDFQPAITGLSTSYIPKWNGSNFVNSLISDDGIAPSVFKSVGDSYYKTTSGTATTLFGTDASAGFISSNGNLMWHAGNGINNFYKNVNILTTTPSTLPTNGALVTPGGIGADHVRANQFYGNGSNLTGVQLPITLTTNGTSGAATFSGNVLNVPNYAESGGVNQTQTTVNGSTSGYIVCSMPFQTASYKKVVVYLNALTGNVTYTFPVQFLRAPQINTGNAGIAPVTCTATATSLTLVGGTNTIGWITLEGY